jgi:hypothetical protein
MWLRTTPRRSLSSNAKSTCVRLADTLHGDWCSGAQMPITHLPVITTPPNNLVAVPSAWTKAVEKLRSKQAALAEQAAVASRLRLAEFVRAPEARWHLQNTKPVSSRQRTPLRLPAPWSARSKRFERGRKGLVRFRGSEEPTRRMAFSSALPMAEHCTWLKWRASRLVPFCRRSRGALRSVRHYHTCGPQLHKKHSVICSGPPNTSVRGA